MTLVEHLQMNSTTISLIGCPKCSLDFWALGLHSVMCWQCVHTIVGVYMHSMFKFNIFDISIFTEENAIVWSPLAFLASVDLGFGQGGAQLLRPKAP